MVGNPDKVVEEDRWIRHRLQDIRCHVQVLKRKLNEVFKLPEVILNLGSGDKPLEMDDLDLWQFLEAGLLDGLLRFFAARAIPTVATLQALLGSEQLKGGQA